MQLGHTMNTIETQVKNGQLDDPPSGATVKNPAVWEIAHYCGSKSICVNLFYKGKNYHRHDYGGFLPRWIRIGWYVRSIQNESGMEQDYRLWEREHYEYFRSGCGLH